MDGELSNGLPRLTTLDNRIVRADTGATVLLRGLNRSGLEYSEPDEQGFLSAAAISRSEIQVIVKEWGANIIRLPFNQDWVLRGRGSWSADAYRSALDQVIQLGFPIRRLHSAGPAMAGCGPSLRWGPQLCRSFAGHSVH